MSGEELFNLIEAEMQDLGQRFCTQSWSELNQTLKGRDIMVAFTAAAQKLSPPPAPGLGAECPRHV